MPKLTHKDKLNIINEYNNLLIPMKQIAAQYNVSRATIYNLLRSAGVNTKKRKIEVTCVACGALMKRTKSRLRRTQNTFCSEDCYFAFLKANSKNSQYWRHGQRLARGVVASVFDLQPGHVVHHKDGNNYNNNLDNLVVFANQGDHIRHHRGCEYNTPLFGEL